MRYPFRLELDMGSDGLVAVLPGLPLEELALDELLAQAPLVHASSVVHLLKLLRRARLHDAEGVPIVSGLVRVGVVGAPRCVPFESWWLGARELKVARAVCRAVRPNLVLLVLIDVFPHPILLQLSRVQLLARIQVDLLPIQEGCLPLPLLAHEVVELLHGLGLLPHHVFVRPPEIRHALALSHIHGRRVVRVRHVQSCPLPGVLGLPERCSSSLRCLRL
mmetsp:Transcript_34447/g.88356  ORF Transcript_34447/g.88356 Transcript_34447/m.88356 type:complete len:220 (-) Transcript_34447:325-984(-)